MPPDTRVNMLVHIRGRFCPETFVRWIKRHAAKLGVTSTIASQSGDMIKLTASGPEILVDALALACTLGPGTAVVDDVKTVLIEANESTG